jgi:hypothetical protein
MADRNWMWALPAAAAAMLALDCRALPPPSALGTSGHAKVTSNVLRDDYAGSKACAGCHAAIHEAWQGSPMHRMTRSVPTEVRADFNGAQVRVKADVATMSRRGDARFMRVEIANKPEQLFRVTRVIGGRYREDFVGVDVTHADDPARDEGEGPETVLPASYVFSTSSWRYKGYSVLVPERPGLSLGAIWSQDCIGCHNTFPELSMLLDDLAGEGSPSFQGSISDDILPVSRAWQARILSENDVVDAMSDELRFLGVHNAGLGKLSTKEALHRSMRVLDKRFEGRHLIEEGVGCEACHGGAREHAENPAVHPSYGPVSPAVAVGRAGGAPFSDSEAKNRVCARCHTVLFSRYPWTWEGGSRKDANPGGSTINSGEARDFLLGSCAGQMTCTTCHDPHAEDAKANLARFDTPAGNGACTSCHAKYAAADALAAHSHHDATGAGSACLSCHMTRKNMGLDYRLTRYHRIGSPTDDARVYSDRPLECAVCHADASAEKLVSTMESWWSKRFDRKRLARLYDGDLGEGSALRRTLEIGKPHEQGVAIGVLGELGKPADACRLAKELDHDYPLVRFFAKHALEKVTGAPVDVDPGASAAEISPAADRWCVPPRP